MDKYKRRFFKTSSVGALAVADSDANVIYAGMGESTIRNDVSYGDGVYKSTDGGVRWKKVGLADTRHISMLRIHPKNPDVVYVAALGHAFGAHDARGVYRSKDGGGTWEKILYKSDKAGAADLSLDTRNPDILYASLWETHRNFWELSSGGPGSGLWRSVDGGDTWREITAHLKLPANTIVGKIGVSASPAQSGRVWALVEASEAPGLYRSDDFGDTWKLVSDKQDLRYRPWYYMHVHADPCDAETVYVNNLNMWRSSDGGRTFDHMPTPHGDNHALWVDPKNNKRMVQGNDGGANVSLNAGASWSTIYNQLTAQIYTVTTDNREPHYRVYGTQQDNSSISVPSNTNDGAIVWGDCYAAGTGESGFMAVHPENNDVVFVGSVGSSPGGGGALQRYDHSSGQIQMVNVWPEAHGGMGPGELKYRFPWTFPVLFSPHEATVLYTAGNVVFRSFNEGQSWEVISPDLTRSHHEKLGPSGGPITKDTSGAEHYCCVSTLRECSLEPGVLWAGSDDGLVHVSKDNGANWRNVTPPELPEWSFIRTVEPSPHEAGTLYLAATRYKLEDNKPYLFKTIDYGASWQAIVGRNGEAIESDDYIRVIRADPICKNVLYAGTETGLYVSVDDGETWQRWHSNLPVTPIYDLTIKNNDLVVATHGRSFWILDDLTPIHQLANEADQKIRLFAPRKTWRLLPDLFSQWIGGEGKNYTVGLVKAATYMQMKDDAGQLQRQYLDAGEGAPHGAIVYYRLDEATIALTNLKLEFLDESGEKIRCFEPKPKDYDKQNEDEQALNPGPWMPVEAGVNRFIWDLRYTGAKRLLGNKTAEEANRGPLVLPGHYQVRLTCGKKTQTQNFEIANDPRSPATLDDLKQQLELLLSIRDKLSQAYEHITILRNLRHDLSNWRDKALTGTKIHNHLIAAIDDLLERLSNIEDKLILPGEHTDTFGLDKRVRLNAALATVINTVDSADAKPTMQARELAGEYIQKIDQQLKALRKLTKQDAKAVEKLIRESKLTALNI